MTAERCPRCQGRMMPDREDGPYCLMCGHRPPPQVLLGIPGEPLGGDEFERWKSRRREPSHSHLKI